ncbi:hypothetical protein V6R21_23930 [Limibacter armeniacum]|uniref:hypothetical protein n=1 Tax=Limibacter armeniacum TaxID=466084 RepID=UPI002FE6BC37
MRSKQLIKIGFVLLIVFSCKKYNTHCSDLSIQDMITMMDSLNAKGNDYSDTLNIFLDGNEQVNIVLYRPSMNIIGRIGTRSKLRVFYNTDNEKVLLGTNIYSTLSDTSIWYDFNEQLSYYNRDEYKLDSSIYIQISSEADYCYLLRELNRGYKMYRKNMEQKIPHFALDLNVKTRLTPTSIPDSIFNNFEEIKNVENVFH